MTDFIPYPTPPGNSGNPKQVHQDYFQVGQTIKVDSTGTVVNDSPTGGPGVKTKDMTAYSTIHEFTPDRRPFLSLLYADQRTHNFAWGNNNVNYRKTPVTDSPDMTSTTANGRIAYMNAKFVAGQGSNANKFTRYMIHSPIGFMTTRSTQQGGAGTGLDGTGSTGYQWGYASTQMLLMDQPYATLLVAPTTEEIPVANYALSTWFQYPNPYTPEGYPHQAILDSGGSADPTELTACQGVEAGYGISGSQIGDVAQAWSSAITWLSGQIGTSVDVTAYLGYALCQETTADDSAIASLLGIPYSKSGTVDNDLLVPEPPIKRDTEHIDSVWQTIADKTAACGFSGVWLDASTRIAEDGENYPVFGNITFVAGQLDAAFDGLTVGYEAVPYDVNAGDNFGGMVEESHYKVGAYMNDFPINSKYVFPAGSPFNQGNTVWGNGGNQRLDKFDLSSVTDSTEVHVWLRSSYFNGAANIVASGGSGSTQPWTWPMLKEFIDDMHSRGLIVSCDYASSGQISGSQTLVGNNKAITIQEVYQYINELYANGSAVDPDV